MPPRDYNSFSRDADSEETPLANNQTSFSGDIIRGKSVLSKRHTVHLVIIGFMLVLLGAFLGKEYGHFHHKSGTVTNIANPSAGEQTEKDTGGVNQNNTKKASNARASGPYKLFQAQEGDRFFDYYDLYDGPDSLGSAGFNRYVGRKRAFDLGIANVTKEVTHDENGKDSSTPYVYMSSASTEKGPRESVRLEGKTTFNRGLFILDLRHMPAGCGIWPAFWLTNEENWPDYGEIDIVEGVNNQTKVKTAMHTSSMCSMYAHVADYNRTGVWDRACKYHTRIFHASVALYVRY
jgi:hypothetical protein